MDRRRLLISAQKKGRLPSKYQEVEYLESTGTQYIDTGYFFTQNSKVEMVFDFAKLSRGAYCLFGSRNSATKNNVAGHLNINTSTSCSLSMDFGDYTNTRLTAILATNTKYRIIDCGEYRALYDGNVVIKINDYTYNQPFSSDYTGFVFYENGNRADFNYFPMKGKVFAYSVDESGIDTQLFIPCYRKSDNVAGMYDLCGTICPLTNSPFYINAGTGEFLVGGDVN